MAICPIGECPQCGGFLYNTEPTHCYICGFNLNKKNIPLRHETWEEHENWAPNKCHGCLTIERGKCLLGDKCRYYDKGNLDKEIERREQNAKRDWVSGEKG